MQRRRQKRGRFTDSESEMEFVNFSNEIKQESGELHYDRQSDFLARTLMGIKMNQVIDAMNFLSLFMTLYTYMSQLFLDARISPFFSISLKSFFFYQSATRRNPWQLTLPQNVEAKARRERNVGLVPILGLGSDNDGRQL